MLIENLARYSSLPNQPYPLNVRLEMSLVSTQNTVCDAPYSTIAIEKTTRLVEYQKVKNSTKTAKRSKTVFVTRLVEIFVLKW